MGSTGSGIVGESVTAATSGRLSRRATRLAASAAQVGTCGAAACSPVTVARSTPASSPIAATPSPLARSEEHTSELQSLMRISYAVLCLTKKKKSMLLSRLKITPALRTELSTLMYEQTTT